MPNQIWTIQNHENGLESYLEISTVNQSVFDRYCLLQQWLKTSNVPDKLELEYGDTERFERLVSFTCTESKYSSIEIEILTGDIENFEFIKDALIENLPNFIKVVFWDRTISTGVTVSFPLDDIVRYTN